MPVTSNRSTIFTGGSLGVTTGLDNSVKSQINSAPVPCEAVFRGILFIIYACLQVVS